MDLSVIIPAYNEENRLPKTLQDIAEFLETTNKKIEIIVVDDGSSDKTIAVAKEHGTVIKNFRVIDQKKNQGKGAAVKRGMLDATGEWKLFMDADNATPLHEVELLWPYTMEYEVIIGSRHLKTSNVVIAQPWYRRFISRAGNMLIQATIVRGIVDTQAGFKLFSKDAAEKIFNKQQITRWGFDMELLAISQKIFGYKIKEVPISWYNSAESRLRPIRDSWRTLKELMKIKMNLISGVYKK
jgi:dolichyl-phosphate beta-glucosyltransferase